MDRRAVLRLFALSLAGGCLANPPGETGPRNPPHETTRETTERRSAVRVAEFEADAAEDGRLRVVGTVENDTGRTVDRTVVVTATVNGTTHEGTTDVTVPAESTAEFSITLDASYEAFNRSGSLRIDLVR